MAIALVQQATNNSGAGTSTTLVITLGASSTVGNTLVACWESNLADLTGISGGGTWVLAKGTGSGHTFSAIWTCVVTSAVTAITLTFAAVTGGSGNVSEWSGVSTNPIDRSASGTGSSTAPSVGSVTPSVDNCVIIAMAAARGAYSSGPSGGFTGLTRDGTATNSQFTFPAYLIQTTAGAATAAWVQGSASWDTAAVTLVPAAQPNAVSLGRTWTTTAGNKTVVATPPAGSLIVVFCSNSGRTTAQPPTVTDNNSSGTYTRHGTAFTKNSSADSGWLFVRDTVIGTATSTTFTMSQTSDSGGGLQVWAISGVTRTGLSAIKQVGKQDNAAAGTPSITMGAAVLTGNPVVGAVFNGTNSATTTAPPSGWTEDGDSGYATPASGLETAHRPGLETNTTIAWTGASASAFGSILAELDTSSTDVNVSAENAAGTGASNQAAPNVSPNAGNASGTGASNAPVANPKPNAGSASGTGAANQPASSLSINAGNASGTGTAWNPTVVSGAVAPAGNAAGTGTANAVTVTLAPNAGNAAGTGTANQPASAVVPNADIAAGLGEANTPASSISGTAGQATGTGEASAPAASLEATAGEAAGTGEASDTSTTLTVNADAATGVGAAWGPSVIAGAIAYAGSAGGLGTAWNPTIVAVSGTPVPPVTEGQHFVKSRLHRATRAYPLPARGVGDAWNPYVRTVDFVGEDEEILLLLT